MLVSARDNYKRGLLAYDRDPREIHKPLLDPTKYAYTYSSDPTWCRLIEYYGPQCGTMMEVEYLPPGHPPLRDMEFDIDAMKAQWKNRDEVLVEAIGKEPARRRAHRGQPMARLATGEKA